MVSAWPAPGLFASRARRNEGVYVDTQLSEDAVRRANRSGPSGCPGATVMRLRTTICRPFRGNAGYADTLNRR
jgi:hypothetical protein